MPATTSWSDAPDSRRLHGNNVPCLVASDILSFETRRPHAPALVSGDQVISYGELAELARKAAADLKGPGINRNRAIALQASKSPRSIAVILACLRMGLPVLLLSPDLGPDVFAALVARSGCQAVVTATGEGYALQPTAMTTAPPELPAGTSLLLTTSGSTGIPKIVPLSAAAVSRFTAWAGPVFSLGNGSRVLNYAPLNFDLCLFDIWATLRYGGTVILVDPAGAVSPRYLGTLLAQNRPQVIQAAPMMFQVLLEVAYDTFPSVRDVLLTGDHAPFGVRARLPHLFPQARFHNVYGCTETNDSMICSLTAEETASRDTLPLGNPLPGAAVSVRGADGTIRESGSGELIVSTPFQAVGYLSAGAQPDADQPRFFRHQGRVWYRTGDVVARDADGETTLVGRTDFQVKIRGTRVNPEETERVLESHEGVLEAVVVSLPTDASGISLHAVVRIVGDADTAPTPLQLRSYCASRLPLLMLKGGGDRCGERAIPVYALSRWRRPDRPGAGAAGTGPVAGRRDV
jgi:acyl-coenzyme A synthetase/AMP-(fatty) acid ligase